MTRLRLPIALAVAIQFAVLGGAQGQEGAAFRLNEKVHNFGNVKLGVPVGTTFTLTSVGDEPVILADVRPSCGCIRADYTKVPMRKGARGKIRVLFNAASPGPFKKSIIVISNAAAAQQTLFITGRVVR